jgi:hypothetical protein
MTVGGACSVRGARRRAPTVPTARHASSTKARDAPRHQRHGQKLLADDPATPLNWLRLPDDGGSNAHSHRRGIRGSVQPDSTRRAPPQCPGRNDESLPAEHAG